MPDTLPSLGDIVKLYFGQLFIVWLISALIFALAGAQIAWNRGHGSSTGALWGGLLGFVGLLVVFSLPVNHAAVRRRFLRYRPRMRPEE